MQICHGFKNFFFFYKHKLHANQVLNFGQYLPKHLETPEIDWNDPKFFPKWNRVGYCSGLFTGTVFFGRYGRNENGINKIESNLIT